jgi:membrane-associated phospholipid phosphatase
MMDPTDYAINLTLSVFLIIGAYQLYFWCQRNPLAEPRQLWLPVDDWIPYRPRWVWIYSLLYYPAILYANLVIDSARDFTHLAISYLVLLGLQMVFFLLFPVATPEAWREQNSGRTRSERFLDLVQRFDARSNSFPSMHTSVATLTALHLYPTLGVWALAFPLLIGLSCLFTKQHYVIDVPAGAVLGWAAFEIFRVLP